MDGTIYLSECTANAKNLFVISFYNLIITNITNNILIFTKEYNNVIKITFTFFILGWLLSHVRWAFVGGWRGAAVVQWTATGWSVRALLIVLQSARGEASARHRALTCLSSGMVRPRSADRVTSGARGSICETPCANLPVKRDGPSALC